MIQYAVVYKPTKMPLAFYCTEEAAIERLKFLTDTNVFGVFKSCVTIFADLKHECSDVEYELGVVCTINNSLLSVHMDTSTAYQHKTAIKAGVLKVCDVSYSIGDEIQPTKEGKL